MSTKQRPFSLAVSLDLRNLLEEKLLSVSNFETTFKNECENTFLRY